jgi:opacity protein-like surface antigen
MNKHMKRLIMIVLSAACMTAAVAQDKVEATIGADFVSQYIWRGQNLGSVSLQPTMGISYKGLSLSSWGSVGLDVTETKELDFTLGYTYKGFNVGVTDYWFSNGSYFQYKAHQTTHIWEANVGYDFGFLSVKWFTNFAGNDGVNKNGERAYSSYFEMTAPYRLGGLEWTATLGAVPWRTTSYDANGFCITNVSLRATKDFVIKEKYHLPVFAGLTGNPRAEKLYIIFGTSFSI